MEKPTKANVIYQEMTRFDQKLKKLGLHNVELSTVILGMTTNLDNLRESERTVLREIVTVMVKSIELAKSRYIITSAYGNLIKKEKWE